MMARVKLGGVASEARVSWTGETAGVPLVGLEHLIPGDIKLKNWASDLADSTFTKAFKKGQVLLGRRRVYLKKAVLAPFDGICSGDITVIESDPKKLSPRLLPFIIQNDTFFDYAMQGSAGSLSPRVKWAHLAEYEFDLPSLDKQEKLADLLWAANDLKEAYQRAIVASDEMAKSRFIEMFGVQDIDECTWPTSLMEDMFEITSSRRILKSEWKQKGNVPFIRVRDMVHLSHKEPLNNEFFVSDEFYNSRPDEEKVRAGDIIISATSTIGETYVIRDGERFYFKDADVLLFRKKKEINNTFFTYGLRMPTVWKQISCGLGCTTVAHFLISKACKLKQPCPPIALQNEFASFIEQLDKSKFNVAFHMQNADFPVFCRGPPIRPRLPGDRNKAKRQKERRIVGARRGLSGALWQSLTL